MISLVRYHAEIVIVIVIVDRLSASLGAGRKRRRRRSATPTCHELKMQEVISTNKLNE
jgi:hypothetical protein